MNELKWIELESSHSTSTTLKLADASIQVHGLGQLGKQKPMTCFVNDTFLAGVDELGWLQLWDSASGRTLARADPLPQPTRLDEGLQVTIAGCWVLGVNAIEQRIQGYRFPYGNATKVGHPCTQTGKQAMLSDDRKRLWIIDLGTAEIDELSIQIEVETSDEEQEIEHRVLRAMNDLPIGIQSVRLSRNRLHVVYKDYSGDWGDGDPCSIVVYDLKNRECCLQRMLGCRDFLIPRPGHCYQYIDVCDGKSVAFRKSTFLSSTDWLLLELLNCNSSVFNMAISPNGCTLGALIRKNAVNPSDRSELLIVDIVHRKLVHRIALPATEHYWHDGHIEFAPSNRQVAVCGASTLSVVTFA